MKHLIKSYFSIAALLSLLVFTACETNKVTDVVLDKTELSLMIGESVTLTADVDYTGSIIPSVVWSSSNEAVITVSNSGVVNALKAGTAVITATASNKSASCTVTVTDDLEIKLNVKQLDMLVGDRFTLSADVHFSGNNIPAVIWASDNQPVIIVSSDGVLSALKAGTAVITASILGKSASCTVTVTDELKPVFTNAEIQFYGNFYSENLNNFVLMLTNSNDTLYLDLNTDTTATTALPVGKYTMLGDFEYFEDFTPMSIIPAFEFEGSSYGSWFFNKVSERPLAEGEMNVSLNGTQYTIGFALTDYDGIKVNGTYSGPAVFNDYSEQMEVIANSSAAKIPGVKHRRTFGLFK